MSDRAALGREAESLACRHLEHAGLALLARNYRCRLGELDLVMRQGETIVFVEVRYRGPSALVDAAASVDRHKQARLLAAAQHYLQQYPRLAAKPCRFDVIAIATTAGQMRVEWITNAFELH